MCPIRVLSRNHGNAQWLETNAQNVGCSISPSDEQNKRCSPCCGFLMEKNERFDVEPFLPPERFVAHVSFAHYRAEFLACNDIFSGCRRAVCHISI